MPRSSVIYEQASILRDVILAASDGIVTTFAVVAGAQGAGLSSDVVVIIGLSGLLADGVSMTAGNYLGVKSEREYRDVKSKSHRKNAPISRHIFATLFPFVLIGFLPLIPYFFMDSNQFFYSLLMVAGSLVLVGLVRTSVSGKHPVSSVLETLLVGGFTAAVAYFVGYFVQYYFL